MGVLTLGRKTGETVVLVHETTGETIEVFVARSLGPVRIAFTAPPSWKIVRKELLDTTASPM